MKFILSLPLLLLTLSLSQGETITAKDLLKRIDSGKPITLRDTTIKGDLDFTQLRKKAKGGSYGGRVGRVKEYFTKLRAPLVLDNCVLEGNLITYREERRKLLVKENFVTFEAPLVLRQSKVLGTVTFEKLAFYDKLVLEDSTFEQAVTITKVDFKKAPQIEGNTFKKGLKAHETNWNASKGSWDKPSKQAKQPERSGILISLRNPSGKSVPIAFGQHRWNLSPRGTSTLEASPGTKIYLEKDGKRDRVILTVTAEMAGSKFDVTRL